MTNPELNELMSAAIDGELDQSARAELGRLLDASDPAREQYEEMQQLVAFIDRTPDVEPPADLRKRILDSVELPAPRRRWLGILDVWTNFGKSIPQGAQLGVSFALGAVLAAGVYSLSGKIPGDMPAEQLVGTMAPDSVVNTEAARDYVVVATPAVKGKAMLQAVDGSWVASFELESSGPGPIDLRVAGQDDQPLRVIFTGKQQFSFAVASDAGETPAPVMFEILGDGQEIFAGRLEAAL